MIIHNSCPTQAKGLRWFKWFFFYLKFTASFFLTMFRQCCEAVTFRSITTQTTPSQKSQAPHLCNTMRARNPQK